MDLVLVSLCLIIFSIPRFVFQVTYDTDSETWSFKTSTMLKSMELKFKLNEEFDEKSPDGRDVKAKVTKEGDSFISIQNAVKEGEKSTKIVWEFKSDRVIQTSTIVGCDLVCTQVFKKCEKKEPLSKQERYRRHYNKTKAEKRFECDFCHLTFTKESNKVCDIDTGKTSSTSCRKN